MPKLLTDDEVDEGLTKLKGWRKEGRFIAKDFRFGSFVDGIAFVNKVSKVAEELDHHPDIHVRYTEVGLRLQTHSEGGVTSRDFHLAKAIDRSTEE